MLPKQHELDPIFLEAKRGALKSSSQLAVTVRPQEAPAAYSLSSTLQVVLAPSSMVGCVCVCR